MRFMCANAAGYSIDPIRAYPIPVAQPNAWDRRIRQIPISSQRVFFVVSRGGGGRHGALTKGGRHVAIVWGALILIIIINIGCSSPKSRKSLALGACLYVKLFLIMQQPQQGQQHLRQQHQRSRLVGQQ